MADSKLLYSTEQSITFTSLNSLAGSSTYLGGGNSAIVDNTSDAYIEVLINGHLSIQTGTITAGRSLELWAYSQIEDSGTLPRYDNTNALSTSSAAVTFASDYLKFAHLKLLKSIPLDTVSLRAYQFSNIPLSPSFGGMIPKKWGLFVTHYANYAIASSGNWFKYVGIKINTA